MTNAAFYSVLLIIYGPVATFLLTSFYYTDKQSRDRQRMWEERVRAEEWWRCHNRATLAEMRAQSERMLREERDNKRKCKSSLAGRLTRIEQWQTGIESRLASLEAIERPSTDPPDATA